MGTLTAGCCGENDCWTLPPEFVRVKYFYGQRLGVMELSDEAVYHAAKHAFHNVRSHGVGILCGLGVDLFLQKGSTTTTVLRVHKGAALDACGREVVVGCDQCVDVAAWYAANKGRPELAGWTPGTTQNLWVAIRYRECPSDPCAAPRDPCGCDNGGCEFGRIREGFELALLTSKETSKLKVTEFPSNAALQKLIGSLQTKTNAVAALDAAIDRLVAKECPAPDDQHWLALAEVPVTLDPTTGVPTSLGTPDITISTRVSLLTTSALQTLALGLVAAGVDSGAITGGPTFGALTFTPTGSGAGSPDGGTFDVAVDLAPGGSPSSLQALVASTFTQSSIVVTLDQLVPSSATGWQNIGVGGSSYTPSPSQLAITVPSGLSGPAAPAAPTIYRLTVAIPVMTPVVDVLGRALTPMTFTRTFGLSLDSSNNLTLAAAF